MRAAFIFIIRGVVEAMANRNTVTARNLRGFSFAKFTLSSVKFSDKGALPNGGNISIRVEGVDVALRILRKYASQIEFWQVAKEYRIAKRGSKPFKTIGFSPQRSPNRATPTEINRALRDTAINAVNQAGHNFKYEGSKPDFVQPTTKNIFTLIIWFHGRHRQTFFEE